MDAVITEKKLIQRILGGEVSFFSRIVDNHQKKIRSFIAKRCSNNADAEDITQEIFIAAYKNLSQYDSGKPFSAWLFGIARNKSNEHFRKAQCAPIPVDVEEVSEVSHVESPDVLLATNEKTKQFWGEARRLLSEEQFTAIWLKYQSDLSVIEISEALQITQSNTKIHLFRARKKLANSNLINQLAS